MCILNRKDAFRRINRTDINTSFTFSASQEGAGPLFSPHEASIVGGPPERRHHGQEDMGLAAAEVQAAAAETKLRPLCKVGNAFTASTW